jgi:diguanylate cyclase (GGDEF)-like protein/PAS domain S-box-containing protein
VHRLLQRQLQRYLLSQNDLPSEEWLPFLDSVSAYYREADQEKTLLENALEVNSQELTSINERLRQQNTEFTHTMLNTLSEGVFATDAAGCFTFLNAAAERLLGWKESEVAGRAVQVMLSCTQLDGTPIPVTDWRIQPVLNGEPSVVDEQCFVCRDQRKLPVRFHIHPLRQADKIIGTLVSFEDISQRRQHEQQIWSQANFDALTQLPNRRMFRDRLEQAVKQCDRSGAALALLFIDLDHFKEINDTLGHEIGDQLLVEAAQRVRNAVRESDTVARLGGDEFTVILTQTHDLSQLENIAQSMLDTLSAPFYLGQEASYLSASIGMTLYPADAHAVSQLLKNADQAMYLAKSLGRNRYAYFTPSLQAAAQARLQMITDLRFALLHGHFKVHFQPIVDLATGRILKAESLIRWQHPQHGWIPPAEFIPLAEEAGLIHDIGDWVFYESTRWAQRWCELSGGDFKISVNVSPIQFMRGDGSSWLQHLRNLNLVGHNLVIEITEGLLLDMTPQIADKLLTFRDAGVQVAIDDFGTGYSSLSYLKKFHIDYLKIDQSFVRDLTTDPNDLALCEAIIVMAHKLGLQVIAEGVETHTQAKLLRTSGCDCAQGFLFAQALPPREFEVLLLAQISPAAT